MAIVELFPTFYSLYLNNAEGEPQLFMQKDFASSTLRYRLDLFEDEASLYRWVKEEQAILAQQERWGVYHIYERFYAKKMSNHDFQQLVQQRDDIDSVTLMTKTGVRRLYFRDDLTENYADFLLPAQKLHAKVPIYIIQHQRALTEQVVLQKEAYFITYPEVAVPLFSLEMREWAEELIERKPNHGYYIEQTTLQEIYQQQKLTTQAEGFFILSNDEAPHYMLRLKDIQQMIEGNAACYDRKDDKNE